MALLERIDSMKQSGMSDSQVINSLKEEGVSPRDIKEALSQSQIKQVVSQEGETGMAGMEPSIRQVAESQQIMQVQGRQSQGALVPSPQAQAQYQEPAPAYAQEAYPAPAPEAAYYPPEAYAAPEQAAYGYPEQQYAPEQGTYYAQAIDVETVRDISKQEIEEALKKVREQIDSLIKMKSDLGFELQSMENRLGKIESVIQEVQSSIIRRMGEYGEAISGVSKEIQATQQSFSKMLGPIMDKKRGRVEIEEEKEETEEIVEKPAEKAKKGKSQKEEAPARKSPSSSAAASFEDYLR